MREKECILTRRAENFTLSLGVDAAINCDKPPITEAKVVILTFASANPYAFEHRNTVDLKNLFNGIDP